MAQRDYQNLINNGDFEGGFEGFFSDLKYSPYYVLPGFFSISSKASTLNSNFIDPKGGDHTTGKGKYLIADPIETSGNIIWRTKVEIKPYSLYRFKAHFCSINLKTVNVGIPNPFTGQLSGATNAIRLLINGKEISSTFFDDGEETIWVETSADWRSETINGLVEIAIQVENTGSEGNDVALDDIAFLYIKNYSPPVLYKRPVKQPPQEPPISKVTPEQRLTLEKVSFEMGKAELKTESCQELDSLVSWMQNNPEKNIKLEGHTDNIGREDYLLELSIKRVESVKSYLVSKGIPRERISTEGFGGTRPLVDNADENIRHLNRRVEMVIY